MPVLSITGWGLYCFAFSLATRSSMFSSSCSSYSFTVIPSISGDLPLFSSLKHSFRKSSVSKCATDVKLHFGLSLALRVMNTSFVVASCPPLCVEGVPLMSQRTPASPFPHRSYPASTVMRSASGSIAEGTMPWPRDHRPGSHHLTTSQSSLLYSKTRDSD